MNKLKGTFAILAITSTSLLFVSGCSSKAGPRSLEGAGIGAAAGAGISAISGGDALTGAAIGAAAGAIGGAATADK